MVRLGVKAYRQIDLDYLPGWGVDSPPKKQSASLAWLSRTVFEISILAIAMLSNNYWKVSKLSSPAL